MLLEALESENIFTGLSEFFNTKPMKVYHFSFLGIFG